MFSLPYSIIKEIKPAYISKHDAKNTCNDHRW